MAPATLNLTPEDYDTLHHLVSILHLFHHRNNNQHRRSVWYRHFSSFRRQLNQFLSDFQILSEVPVTHLARTRKKVRDSWRHVRIKERLSLWRDILVPRWQYVFSQLMCDGRFAVLGIVLIAVLSQVCAMLGIVAELEQLAQREIETVLENFEKEDWGLDVSSLQHSAKSLAQLEDLGEVVKREDVSNGYRSSTRSNDTAPPLESTQASQIERPSSTKRHPIPEASSKRNTKKRKNANAIDDLFNVRG